MCRIIQRWYHCLVDKQNYRNPTIVTNPENRDTPWNDWQNEQALDLENWLEIDGPEPAEAPLQHLVWVRHFQEQSQRCAMTIGSTCENTTKETLVELHNDCCPSCKGMPSGAAPPSTPIYTATFGHDDPRSDEVTRGITRVACSYAQQLVNHLGIIFGTQATPPMVHRNVGRNFQNEANLQSVRFCDLHPGHVQSEHIFEPCQCMYAQTIPHLGNMSRYMLGVEATAAYMAAATDSEQSRTNYISDMGDMYWDFWMYEHNSHLPSSHWISPLEDPEHVRQRVITAFPLLRAILESPFDLDWARNLSCLEFNEFNMPDSEDPDDLEPEERREAGEAMAMIDRYLVDEIWFYLSIDPGLSDTVRGIAMEVIVGSYGPEGRPVEGVVQLFDSLTETWGADPDSFFDAKERRRNLFDVTRELREVTIENVWKKLKNLFFCFQTFEATPVAARVRSENCNVCLDKYSGDGGLPLPDVHRIARLPCCGAFIHFGCLSRVILETPRCPFCRADMNQGPTALALNSSLVPTADRPAGFIERTDLVGTPEDIALYRRYLRSHNIAPNESWNPEGTMMPAIFNTPGYTLDRLTNHWAQQDNEGMDEDEVEMVAHPPAPSNVDGAGDQDNNRPNGQNPDAGDPGNANQNAQPNIDDIDVMQYYVGNVTPPGRAGQASAQGANRAGNQQDDVDVMQYYVGNANDPEQNGQADAGRNGNRQGEGQGGSRGQQQQQPPPPDLDDIDVMQYFVGNVTPPGQQGRSNNARGESSGGAGSSANNNNGRGRNA